MAGGLSPVAPALSENEVTRERCPNPSQALQGWCPRLGTFHSRRDERQGLPTRCAGSGALSAVGPRAVGPSPFCVQSVRDKASFLHRAASAEWEPRGGAGSLSTQERRPQGSRATAGPTAAVGCGLRDMNTGEHLLGSRCPAGRRQGRCHGRERRGSAPPGKNLDRDAAPETAPEVGLCEE